jgi:MutS domain V
MNHKSFPAAVYDAQINELNGQLSLLKKRKDRISWTRLAIILLLIAVAYYLYPVSILYAMLSGIILLAIFIRLVILAADNSTSIENTKWLISVNQQEITITGGNYTKLPDGANFLYPTHHYANDLDIFGRASVYQYINRTQSQQGNATLANWLLEPSALETIIERQTAVKELAAQYKWRQQVQAYGMEEPITITTEKKVTSWIQQENTFSHNIGWKILRWIYPIVTISLVVLYAIDILPIKWLTAAYIIALGVSGFIKKIIFPQYSSLDKIVPEIDALFKSAQYIESNPFNSHYLQQQQEHFLSGNTRSSVAIKQLKNILDKFDASLNLVLAMILNPLLLWDLQLIFRLEKWRTDNKTKTLHWFTALGEIESVSTIANVHFNHPAWVFPVFDSTQHGTFQSTEMGHPLIPGNKMVYNDFSTAGTAQVALITGSNMAGKSTFLRSTAVNMVLAMMGAPVCAKEMRLSPMRVISSMRVADNLEESTSTFYAELKKLKSIIECVNNHEKVFVLLDEILRGTNSLDRHTGSKALIKQLINKNAVAMLATHDVELAQLQNDYPSNIHNYHFDAQIANEELYFDYKLKEGICKSINASILMKKIGIEL